MEQEHSQTDGTSVGTDEEFAYAGTYGRRNGTGRDDRSGYEQAHKRGGRLVRGICETETD